MQTLLKQLLEKLKEQKQDQKNGYTWQSNRSLRVLEYAIKDALKTYD